jgi:hypothetical protein
LAAIASGIIPAPPAVNLVYGVAPGLEQNAMGTAAYNRDTDTVYYQGKLDPATRAHELGHAFDDQVLTDGDRQYFQRIMQAPAGEWRTGTGIKGGHLSPSEWFADYYQASALGLDPRKQSEAAYAQVGPKRLRQFEKALGRLAKRHKLQPYS